MPNDAPAPAATDAPRSTRSLAQRVVGAAGLEVLSYGANMAVRFGGNLILTRLLMPEAFGLMALLTSVQVVLSLLSEVGLSQAVVMSPRGDDPAFLDTVFSLQALRGLLMWLAVCVLTVPLGMFFGDPRLYWILPIGALTSVLHGVASTRPFTLRRMLRPAPVLIMEVGANVVGLIVNVTGSWAGFGVKALVAGVIAAQLASTIASHLLPGTSHRVRFRIDPAAKREIVHFGRWIFYSSCLVAITERGDYFMLGRLLGAATLGIYNIAVNLAEIPSALVSRVLSGVVYPALARVRDEPTEVFVSTYYGMRRWIDPVGHIGMGLLIGLAPFIVDLLFDERYAGAAPMLQIIALRSSLSIMALSCEYCFIARGESKLSFRRNLFVALMLVVCLPAGHALGGTEGVLWGAVLARSTALAALWPAAHARGFLRLSREALVIPYLLLGWGVGTLLQRVLPDV